MIVALVFSRIVPAHDYMMEIFLFVVVGIGLFIVLANVAAQMHHGR